jgi:hypothetical protein
MYTIYDKQECNIAVEWKIVRLLFIENNVPTLRNY